MLQDPSVRSALGQKISGDYLMGVLFGCIGWTLLFAGYRLRLFRIMSSRSMPVVTVPYLWLVVGPMLAIGWASRIYAYSTLPDRFDVYAEFDVTPLLTLAMQLGFLATAAVVVLLIYWTNLTLGMVSKVITCILLVCEAAVAVPSGSRAQLFVVVAIVVSWLGFRGPLRMRTAWAILAVVLIYLFGFLQLYRAVEDSGSGISRLLIRFQNTVELALAEGPASVFAASFQNIGARFHGMDSVASVLHLGVPQGHQWGVPFVVNSVAPFVPRLLWPAKPTDSAGNEFAIQYFGVFKESGVHYAPTWLGDLLLQFPPIMALAALFLLGVFLRWLREFGLCEAKGGGVSVKQFLYLMIVPSWIMTDGWIHVAMYESARAGLAAVVILVALRSVRMRESA